MASWLAAGRRVRKQVIEWDPNLGESGAWDDENPQADRRFVYHNWLLLVEYEGDENTIVRKHTWGLELSGSLEGAGGMGGLLAAPDAQGSVTTPA